MAGKTIHAAGGIVVRNGARPLIAVVQRAKDELWVLPRGKLKLNESPLAGARREVVEETGHRVRVREFLGAITYRARGRPKVVQFWRMQAEVNPSRDLMKDIMAVEWLPLSAAVRRLSYPLEKLFLRNVGRRRLRQRKHRKSTSRRENESAPARRENAQRRNRVASPPRTAAQERSQDIRRASRQAKILQRVLGLRTEPVCGTTFRRAAIASDARPQALRKFNLRKQAVNQFQTGHSPTIHAENRNLASTLMVDAEQQYAGNERIVVECIRTQRTKGRCAMTKMTKTLTALAAAATLGIAAVAAPQPAEAAARWRDRRRHHRRTGRRRHHRSAAAQRALLRPTARAITLTLRPGLLRRLLLDPPAGLGRLGLARSTRAGLRLRL